MCMAESPFISRAYQDFAVRPGSAPYELLRAHPTDEFFVLNIQLPGPPNFSLVMVFRRSPTAASTPAEKLWDKFCAEGDKYRNSRLKLLANVVAAPFAIRLTMPNKPAIVGNRLPIRFHAHPRCLEAVLDVGTSAVAGPPWRLMKGQTVKVRRTMEKPRVQPPSRARPRPLADYFGRCPHH